MNVSFEEEEWRPVVGYEGLYSVSNLGRVRRDVDGRGHCKAGRILKLWRIPGSGLQAALYKGGKRHGMLVHRLVMAAFVGPVPEGQEVAHGDGDPCNNRLDNLRYAAHTENMLDCHRYGGRTSNQRLALTQVSEIRKRLDAGERQASIARRFGVSRQTIRHIKTGRNWGHRLDQTILTN